MSKVVIKQPGQPILDVLGENGEHWGNGWGDWREVTPVMTCLHGAIRHCSPVPGDAYLIEEVGMCFGFGTAFSDGSDWPAVRVRIAQGFDITDGMLLETFGPQWEPIVALVRSVASVTTEQTKAFSAAGVEASSLAAEWYAALDAARDVSCPLAADDVAAQVAAEYLVWDGSIVWARAAARALACRHLISPDGFTQQHYDTLVGPYASAFGKAHPGDKEAK